MTNWSTVSRISSLQLLIDNFGFTLTILIELNSLMKIWIKRRTRPSFDTLDIDNAIALAEKDGEKTNAKLRIEDALPPVDEAP